MPRLIQRRLFAAALLFTALTGAPARAEMTDADRAGQRAFAACMDGPGGGLAACIGKLSLYAWYPANDENCAKVGARADKIIELDGQPKWINLFSNERCARLGMPHGAVAARAGARWDPKERYAQCIESGPGGLTCEDGIGRHAWHPYKEKLCQMTAEGLMNQREDRKKEEGQYIWRMLFVTERCHRLGLPYLPLEAAQ